MELVFSTSASIKINFMTLNSSTHFGEIYALIQQDERRRIFTGSKTK